MSAQKILIGTHDTYIYTLLFDPSTLSLTQEGKTEVDKHPSWLTPHPKHKDIIYSNGHVNGKVFCLRLTDDGVEVLHEAITSGTGPTHLALLPDCSGLIMAHYGSGNVTLLPLDPSGRITAKQPTDKAHFRPPSTSLPHPRQEAAHAHQAVMYKDEVLIPDLGSNKVWRIKWNGDERGWEQVGEIGGFENGDGPRHCILHPSGGYLYTLTELNSYLVIHDITGSEAKVVGRISILPPGDESVREKLGAAELVFLPALSTSKSGKALILCSNRDSPSRGDALACFSVSPDGKSVERTEQGWVTGLGKHLRGVEVDKTGKWVCVVGRDSGGVSVLERKGEEGLELEKVAGIELELGVCPLWV